MLLDSTINSESLNHMTYEESFINHQNHDEHMSHLLQQFKHCQSTEIQTLNPLHPYINMHILHTILFTFPKVLTRRISLTVKRVLHW